MPALPVSKSICLTEMLQNHGEDYRFTRGLDQHLQILILMLFLVSHKSIPYLYFKLFIRKLFPFFSLKEVIWIFLYFSVVYPLYLPYNATKVAGTVPSPHSFSV